MATLPEITVLGNKNNKTSCPYLAVIKLYDPTRYRIGGRFNFFLATAPNKPKKKLYKVEIVAIRDYFLHQITEFVSYLAMECSPEKCREEIIKNAPGISDWADQKVSFILLKQIKN
jgi:hypothetical protein